MATYKLKLSKEFNNEELESLSLEDVTALAKQGKLNENTLVFNPITKAWDPVQTKQEIYTIVKSKGIEPDNDTYEILFSDPNNPSITKDTKYLKIEDILALKNQGAITPNTYFYCKEKHNWIPIKNSPKLHAVIFEGKTHQVSPIDEKGAKAKHSFKNELGESKIKFSFKEDLKKPSPQGETQVPTSPQPIIAAFDEEKTPKLPQAQATPAPTAHLSTAEATTSVTKPQAPSLGDGQTGISGSKISLKGYEKPKEEPLSPPPPAAPLTPGEKIFQFIEFQQSIFISLLYVLTAGLMVGIHLKDLPNIWDELLALNIAPSLISYPFILLAILCLGIGINHITFRENFSAKRSLIYLSGIWYLLCIYWFLEDSHTVYYKVAFSGLTFLMLTPFTFHNESKINIASRLSAALLLGYWYYYYGSYNQKFILSCLIFVGVTLFIDTFKFSKLQIIKVSVTFTSLLIVAVLSALYFMGVL